MRKKLPVIAISCILIIGICVLLYPAVSAVLEKMTQSTVIAAYQRTVDHISTDEIERMKTEAREYNDNLYGAFLSDPFAEDEVMDTSYVKLLDVDEVMGYIEVPQISVYLPIYHGSSEEVLKKGVGHLENTSLPIGGESTHTVMTGHTGMPSATLFTDLDQLVECDVFYLHVLNEVLAYEVNQIKVVEPENTQDLTIAHGKDYVTLVTCTPYGINTQRLLVRGTRIEYIVEEEKVKIQFNLVSEVVIVPTIFIIIAVLPMALLVIKKRRGRR